MIGVLVSLVRTLVVDPQAADTYDSLHRIRVDRDEVEADPALNTVSILPISTDPLVQELAAGMGIGGPVMLRHVISVVLEVKALDGGTAETLRDSIALDMLGRGMLADWYGQDTGDLEVERVTMSVAWTDYEDAASKAWATITYTIDTAWTPTVGP